MNVTEGLHNMDGRVAPALRNLRRGADALPLIVEAKQTLSALQAAYDPTTNPDERAESLRLIAVAKTTIYNLNLELQDIEKQIELRSPNGRLWVQKFSLIEDDRARARVMLSGDSYDQRQGEVRLQGLDKIETEWNVELAKLNARRKTLTGV
jgi:hypothetical protein